MAGRTGGREDGRRRTGRREDGWPDSGSLPLPRPQQVTSTPANPTDSPGHPFSVSPVLRYTPVPASHVAPPNPAVLPRPVLVYSQTLRLTRQPGPDGSCQPPDLSRGLVGKPECMSKICIPERSPIHCDVEVAADFAARGFGDRKVVQKLAIRETVEAFSDVPHDAYGSIPNLPLQAKIRTALGEVVDEIHQASGSLPYPQVFKTAHSAHHLP